jgi:hypothetical protein
VFPRVLPSASHFFSFFILLFSFLLPPFSFASAQSIAYAEIGAPDLSAFPDISALLDVYDANGQFVSGLNASDVTATEDGTPRPVQKLSESPVGAQIVVVVNPGPALDVRDGQGVTRYQHIQQTLAVWAQARQQAEVADDLSLVTISGPLVAHTDPESWLASLTAFQPNFKATTPNIQSLGLAVDSALSPTQTLGVKRAVLFITPHMEDLGLADTLSNIATRAAGGRVRVFVWFVDADIYYNHPSAQLFQAFAAQTGGAYATFNGLGGLPDPETYFSPLRRVYRLTYASGLTVGGDHTLGVDVAVSGARIASVAQKFTLDLRPPNPIIAALPAQITRQPASEDSYEMESLVPKEQALGLIVEFPDGRKRPLVRTVLYVDGAPVSENVSAPFDAFVWDLGAYTASGQHILKVEATDSFGLTGSSIDLPVSVQVIKPKTGLVYLLAHNRYLIVGITVGVAGLALFIILFGSRLRLRTPRQRRAERRQREDPLTQPVVIAATEPKTGAGKNSRRAKPLKVTDAPAFLIRLAPDGEAALASPMPIHAETTIGADPVQASVVLDEPAIAPLHVRIQQGGDVFTIFDQGSAAGTWVNYEAVTREGHSLKHGDRVHLGNLMFRFELRNPPHVSEPTVTLADP